MAASLQQKNLKWENYTYFLIKSCKKCILAEDFKPSLIEFYPKFGLHKRFFHVW